MTRRSRHRRVLAVAGVVVVAAAAVITAVAIPAAEPAGSTPLIVGADAWTRATAGAGLSDWPSQGDLTGDKPLLRAAGAALSAATQEPAGSFLVLYAGDLPGTGPLVVLGDPNGPVEGSVVSYRPGQPLRTLGDFHKDLDEPDLVPLPGGRLLVPPWHTGLRFAWLSGGSTPLSWQVLHVAGGIAAVPQLREKQNLSGCYGNLAAVQYQDDAFGRSLRSTGTDVIGRQYGQLAAWPAQVADRGSPKATPADIQDLADLTCGEQGSHELWLYAGAEAGYRVNVTDLGTGPLPGASGPVTAVSVDVQDGDLRTPDIASSPLDGSQVQFLNTTSGQPVAAGAHDAPGGSPDDISGAWWQPKAGGSWYLLAAGVRGLRAVSSAGVPLHRVSGSGSFAVFSAGTATPAKAGPVLLEAAANGGPVGATVLPPAAAGG